MEEFTPQQKRRLERIAEVIESGPLALAKFIFELEEKIDEAIPDTKSLLAKVRGNDGYTPKIGVDYYTKADKDKFVNEVYSRIVIPVVKNGITPKAGIDYPTKKQISDYIDARLAVMKPEPGYTPQKGFDYFTDEDIRLIALDVLSQIEVPETKIITIEESGSSLIKKINAAPLTDENKIDYGRIKNLPPPVVIHDGGGYGAPLEPVIKAGANISVYKDISGAWVISSTGGGGSNPPSITLSASPSQVKEKGSTVSAVDLEADTVKGSNDITAVEFFRDDVLINSVASPNPLGGTETYTDTVDVTDDTEFTATVSDGVDTITSNTVTYEFVYPFYYGSAAPGTTEANIEALTKLVATKSDKTLTFNPTVQVYKFAYPASYGLLDKIKDDNGFDITDDWTLFVVSVTGLDGNPVDYNLYQFNNLTTQSDFDITFEF